MSRSSSAAASCRCEVVVGGRVVSSGQVVVGGSVVDVVVVGGSVVDVVVDGTVDVLVVTSSPGTAPGAVKRNQRVPAST